MEPQPASRLPLDALLAEAGWLRALARSLVSDPSTADDLVQETWLAALKHPPAADRPLRPWLRTVVENFARMRRRGDGARAQRERAQASDAEHAGEQELVERVEEQRYLAREVLRLDEPYRSCLVLRYYEGLTSEQIAERLGSNENTVRWRMKRALETLRERLDRRHAGDRGAWLALLTPLTLPPVDGARAAPTSVASSASPVIWVAAGAAVLVASLTWVATHGSDAPLPADPDAAALTASTTNPGDAIARSAERRAAPQAEVGAWARASGRIVDTSGAAVAGARVVLLARDELDGVADLARLAARTLRGVAHARSGAEGAFELQLPHTLRARASDVVVVEAEDCLRAWAHAPLEFVDAWELGALTLARAAGLKGALVDESDRPVEGARVALERVGSRWPSERVPPLEEARRLGSLLEADAPFARSDARGAFDFSGLAAGYWRVWAGADGRESAWAGPIAVNPGERAEAPRLVLPPLDPARCVRGQVVNSRGEPVANAEVEGARTSLRREFFVERSGVVRARTDRDGRFVLAAEAGGAYQLAARAGERLAQLDWNVGDGRDARLVLREPLALRVEFEGGAHQPHSTEEAFEFELRDALDGRRLLRREARCDGRGADLVVDHWRAVTLEVKHGEGVARVAGIELDAGAQPLSLRLARPPRVVVRVTADGVALEGARVELLQLAPQPRTVSPAGSHSALVRVDVEASDDSRVVGTSDAAGVVELRPAREAAHVVRVEAAGWPSTLSPLFSIGAGRELELELRPGGAIEGMVSGYSPGDVAGAIVHVARGDGLESSVRVGADGRYRFEGLAPGPWQVRLGLALAMPRAQTARVSQESLRDDVEVASGAVARFDLRLPSAPRCRLFGRVTLDGKALGPCVVELTRPGKQRVLARGWSDPAGEFELALDEPGEFELRVDSLDPSGARYEVRHSLRLAEGRTTLDLAAQGATHVFESPAAPTEPTDFVVRVEADVGGLWSVRVPIDAEGRARLQAPLGATRSGVGELDPSPPVKR